MNQTFKFAMGVVAATLFATPFAGNAVEVEAGDWNFTLNGNVNVHYIHSQCDDTAATVAGGLACNAGNTTDAEDGISTVSNGLLPAAFVLGVNTQQDGWDISGALGLYPGISTNDGGSPNLQQNGQAIGPNTGLGTTGLDVRQVFMKFGKKGLGTFKLGRDFGLFGFDAIINDMTIPGVGVAGAMASANPANTSLGSIGLGYLYTDTLAQMNYTTPEFAGLSFTIGIFDPLEPVDGTAPSGESAPGVHGKLSYTRGSLYLSSSFISQENSVADANGNPDTDYDSFAVDVGGKLGLGPFEFLAWYYTGEGIGTTALLFFGSDGNGNERDSDGFLAQCSYQMGQTRFGLNYGQSTLDHANAADAAANPNLVEKNSKITFGVYHSLTANLTLLAEYSDVEAEAHDGSEIQSSNLNFGAFLSF